MHVANRHVERWAPETSAHRVRPLRSLGFVDRLVAPWIETAQRSAGLRLFSQYASQGTSEREGGAVSWVFPRPWYQDELDWMAASRRVGSTVSEAAAPSMFTTRGTYVAPTRTAISAPQAVLPTALYEYVAPSLSVAQPAAPAGVGYGGSDAYSPLVSLAAVQAAELMSRAVAPFATGRMTPALRTVLTTMLERASVSRAAPSELSPTRLAMQAPELVTPPAPRARDEASATQLAEHYATQRTQVAELQRIAHKAAERELAARPAPPAEPARETAQRAEIELRQRAAEARQAATTTSAAERARIEERIAARIAERTSAQRLHEQARHDAATHARAAELAASVPAARAEAVPAAPLAERRAPAEVAAAMAALPGELAAFLGQRPERAMQAIGELNEGLRTVELMARTAASGSAFETTRGPRLMMPAGLGGLVAAVDRAQPRAMPIAAPTPSASRVPSLPWLSGPRTTAPAAATTAFGATTSTTPAALTHVAWADRWLARFAGASPQSLGVLTAASASSHRMDALAAAAPNAIFVAPQFDASRVANVRFDDAGRQVSAPALGAAAPTAPALAAAQAAPIERFDDTAETPDDVFAQIAAAATRSRVATPPAQPTATAATAATPSTAAQALAPATWAAADAIAHAAPVAPGAGLSAQLASSPFASALQHLLPLPASASFDVRSLFGGALSATYLAGLLGPASHELEVASAGPAWAPGAGAAAFAAATRAPIEWDAAYVAPEGEAPSEAAPLTTLRTALLSWNVDAAMPTLADAPTVVGTSQTSPITTRTARAMIEAMSMPMLGDVADDRGRPVRRGRRPA